MPAFIDLTGRTSGQLVVLQRDVNRGRSTMWICKCVCGNEVSVAASSITDTLTQSCGCMSNQFRSLNSGSATHRMSTSMEYKTWQMMKQRCTNPNYTHYEYYGGRGIKVCPEWMESFEQFALDMGPRPMGFTIDRVECDGDYEPGNCRWASREQQVDNRRNAVVIIWQGQQVSLKELAARYGTTRVKIYNYLYRGHTLESAIARCKTIA